MRCSRALNNKITAAKFDCHRIMLKSADPITPGSCYCTVSTELRKNSVENMLKKIYEHDFVEPESQYIANNKIKLNQHNFP